MSGVIKDQCVGQREDGNVLPAGWHEVIYGAADQEESLQWETSLNSLAVLIWKNKEGCKSGDCSEGKEGQRKRET